MLQRSTLGFTLAMGLTGSALAGTMGTPVNLLHGTYAKPGVKFCTEDNGYCARFFFNLQGDYTSFNKQQYQVWRNDGVYVANNDPNLVYLRNGARFKRARFYMIGHVFTDWNYFFEVDFAVAQIIKDMYFQYAGFKNFHINFGQMRVNTDMVRPTPSFATNFLERSIATQAFTPDRRMVLSGVYYNPWVMATAGIFGSDYRGIIFADNLRAGMGNDPFGANARLFITPWQQVGKLAGIGASVWYQRGYDSNGIVGNTGRLSDNYRFRNTPGIAEYRGRVINDTGSITNVDNVVVYALEGVFALGSMDLSAAYFRDDIKRTGGLERLNYQGGYVQAGYFLTGESRKWLGKVAAWGYKTENTHAYGAFQVIARYDVVDLNDVNATQVSSWYGGKQRNITLGLNYYPNDVIRFMLNVIHGKYTPLGGLADRSYNMVGARAQILA